MDEEKFKIRSYGMDGTGTLLQSGSASELSITLVASLGSEK